VKILGNKDFRKILSKTVNLVKILANKDFRKILSKTVNLVKILGQTERFNFHSLHVLLKIFLKSLNL